MTHHVIRAAVALMFGALYACGSFFAAALLIDRFIVLNRDNVPIWPALVSVGIGIVCGAVGIVGAWSWRRT